MSNLGDTIKVLFITMAALLIIFVPLGLWKIIEIIIWVFNHVSISVN